MIEDSSLNRNQGTILKERCMSACGQKKEGERKLSTTTCMCVYLSFKTSGLYDIIEKTISGHERSQQPESIISGLLSLAQIPKLLCSKKVIPKWLLHLYAKQECPSTWFLDQTPRFSGVLPLLPSSSRGG